MRSKKPSARNSGSTPPERPVLFVDRSLGRRQVPQALREAGAAVEIHDDHFAPDMADERWLAEVANRGWTVLTKDRRIRYRPNEIAAIRNAGALAVVLTAGNLTGDDMAAIFVRALRGIERLARSSPRRASRAAAGSRSRRAPRNRM